MTSIFIDGEAGTTGLGIRERLQHLPVERLSIAESARKDPAARLAMMERADIVILCLPDAAAREAVSLAATLEAAAPRILDASSAHRTAAGWVYGFPEYVAGQPTRIAGARLVSNPGCYATGAVALLRPLVDGEMIPPDHPLTINAISGYSGGGRQMIEAHERDGGPAFELYGLGLEHKHIPEIQAHGGLSRRPIFVPSVGHFSQGMLVCIPLHLDDLPGRPAGADLRAALAARYADSTHISVPGHSSVTRMEPDPLNGTDRLDLHVFADDAHRQAILVARLDNLGKGASGAAVQNLRLMLDLEEPV